ncbi:MAG: hypothetical protein LBB43_01610 [Spirochaetaceae bacterium]|jgi:hypothetical protein|nr:hypothetical protein [Spirochaetaceae bacterium]
MFDVCKPWIILVSVRVRISSSVAAELAHYLDVLRRQAGNTTLKMPAVKEVSNVPAGMDIPVIFLDSADYRYEYNGYSWRIGSDRVEIYGESRRGLCNGVFDFLANLGIQWDDPDKEILPKPQADRTGIYSVDSLSAYCPSSEHISRRRALVIKSKLSIKKQEKLLCWAVRNKIDTVIFSLYYAHKALRCKKNPLPFFFKKVIRLAEEYAFIIEWGGWDMPILIPRRYYLFKPDMFRMDQGKRIKDCNFCPSSPEAIALISKRAQKLLRIFPNVEVYHIWADQGHERNWCSCPSCRAFSIEEQNRIACITVSDVLSDVNPRAHLCYIETSNEQHNIELRPNMVKLTHFPSKVGADLWLLTD